MPNIYYDTLDECPEGLRQHARELEGGRVTVNVVPESKLSEFRDKNIQLSKENEDLIASNTVLKGIVGDSPDDFKNQLDELRAVNQRVKDGELKEGRHIEEAIAKRTEEMRKGYQDQLASEAREKSAWKTRAEQENTRYKEQVVVSAIRAACAIPELGVLPTAVDDVVERAKRIFRVSDDGKLTAYNGDAMIYGANGADSVTPQEWVGKLRESNSYFFKGSHGGGGGGEGGNGGGRNEPKIAGKFTKEQWAKMSPRDRLAAANSEPGATL